MQTGQRDLGIQMIGLGAASGPLPRREVQLPVSIEYQNAAPRLG